MMKRLTHRSLLLTTILSLTSQIQGAAMPEGLKTDSLPYPSVRNYDAPTITAPVVVAPTPQNVVRPSEHHCPITQEVMKDPVVAEDGHSYEREAILKWVNANHTSPLTRAPMSSVVHPNQSLRLLIEEWNEHQTYRPSVLAELSADEIVGLLNEEFKRNTQLLEPAHTASGKDIVVFLGHTGAGKSTLINFLAGKELSVVGTRYALTTTSDPEAMPIGTHIFKSETLYPKSIDINNNQRTLRYFDLPGFKDTDGSVRNLVNAAFVRKILLDADTLRFVYVAGQDQFTADRGASVNGMIETIKRLLVMVEQGSDPVSDGLFVVTKEEGLIDEVIAKNQEGIPEQIRLWYRNGKIGRMYQAGLNAKNNQAHREDLLNKVENLRTHKLSTLNVSALYPPETEKDIKRMYMKMFENAYAKKKAASKTTFTEYARAIQEWSQDGFWQAFEEGYLNDEYPSISVLKEFTITPYRSAWDEFAQKQNADRAKHTDRLKQQKRDREDYIKQDTIIRATREVNAYKEEHGMMDVVPFDFANHVEYRQRVCGSEVLERITQDKAEHEIAIRVFIDWIRPYYQDQIDQQVRKPLQEQIRQQDRDTNELKDEISRLRQQLQQAEAVRMTEARALQEQIQALQAIVDAQTRQFAQEVSRLDKELRIPDIARGHEEVYQQFLRGKLIYKPNKDNDDGRKEFRIGDLANPLNGTFDLSGCGDSDQHLSISTGFRTGKNPANKNKLEIWIVPQFVLQKDLRAKPYNEFLQKQDGHRNKPFAILFNWGGWNGDDYAHGVTGDDGNEFDHLGSAWNAAAAETRWRPGEHLGGRWHWREDWRGARDWQISLHQ